MKKKWIKPKLFKPTEEQTRKAMEDAAQYFSPDKQLLSEDHPNIKVRGTRSTDSTTKPL